MRTPVSVRWYARWFGLPVLALLALWSPAFAQTTTGRVHGSITDQAGAPLAQTDVSAIATMTGVRRTAQSNGDGVYNLPSLPPTTYRLEVRRIGFAPQAREFRVGIGQDLVVDFQLSPSVVQLQDLVVVSQPVSETRSTEVATNVSQAQIENLPTASRNFLDLAQLAPSVKVSEDRVDGTGKTFRSGALPAENINVFIDGASYKNDVISGGIAGQDASRGNPFPRNAVQEYRVITNNYKAEYQKASSAIITAATKSGGNTWQGSAFATYQSQRFVALDSFRLRDQANNPTGFVEPEFNRTLFGLSAGGPIMRDRLFFFGSYEGNMQNRDGVTRFGGDPANRPADVAALEGDVNRSPFRSHLFFSKLTYNVSDRSMVEFTGDWRHETDTRGFGGQFSGPDVAFSAAERFKNDVATGRVKHTLIGDNWVNEAFVAYQWYGWNPDPVDFTTVGRQYNGIGRIGGRDSRQDISQKRWTLRDDITFSGIEMQGSHQFKVGANVDFARYSFSKQLNENPLFIYDASNNFDQPVEAVFGFGDPIIKNSNAQFGIYAQDDWAPTSRLTLNLGVRYDYESGSYNRDYITPQAVRDSITALRPDLFVDVDPARYFTDGTQRKAFAGAIQPRVGVSYALDELGTTALFGSFGVFYDRINFNSFVDETYRRQHPNYRFLFNDDGSNGRIMWEDSYMSAAGLQGIIASGNAPPQEVFLLPNDLKPPKSYQWSGGIRHDFGGWNASANYTGIRGKNGFTFEWANLSFDPARNDCCISTPTPAYQNILVGNNDVRSWYNALEVKVDRPYRRASDGEFGWGAGLAYTFSKAEAEGNDLFTFPQVALVPRRAIGSDTPHRIVGNWIVDLPYLFGIQWSGLAEFSSGTPFNKLSFEGGQRSILGQERGQAYKRVDFRFRKDLPAFMGGTRLGVTADIFNAFNFTNLGCYDEAFLFGDGAQNDRFGFANCIVTDARKLQLGMQLDF